MSKKANLERKTMLARMWIERNTTPSDDPSVTTLSEDLYRAYCKAFAGFHISLRDFGIVAGSFYPRTTRNGKATYIGCRHSKPGEPAKLSPVEQARTWIEQHTTADDCCTTQAGFIYRAYQADGGGLSLRSFGETIRPYYSRKRGRDGYIVYACRLL